MTSDQLTQALEEGSAREIYILTMEHLHQRAAQSRQFAFECERAVKDATEQAALYSSAAEEFERLAGAIERASITFPALAIEAGTDETLQAAQPVGRERGPIGNAQPEYPKPSPDIEGM